MVRMTPYTDPEYLRQLHITPYDYEADMAAEQHRQLQASLAFRRAQLREESRRAARQILAAIGFAFVALALIFIGACA